MMKIGKSSAACALCVCDSQNMRPDPWELQTCVSRGIQLHGCRPWGWGLQHPKGDFLVLRMPSVPSAERKKFQAEPLIRLGAESEFALQNPGQHKAKQLLQPWKGSKMPLPHVQTLSLTSLSDKERVHISPWSLLNLPPCRGLGVGEVRPWRARQGVIKGEKFLCSLHPSLPPSLHWLGSACSDSSADRRARGISQQ